MQISCRLYDTKPRFPVINLRFDEDQFYPCFLHILNLACQAAIEVYDPTRKKKAGKVVLVPEGLFDEFSGSEDSNDPDDSDFYPEDDDKDEFDEVLDIETKSNTILKVYSFLNTGKKFSCLYKSKRSEENCS